jgi:hypothetical protein
LRRRQITPHKFIIAENPTAPRRETGRGLFQSDSGLLIAALFGQNGPT